MKTLIWETHDEHAYRTTPAELLADNLEDEAVADAVAYLKGEAKKRGFDWAGVCFGGGAAGLTFITVRRAGVVLPHEDEMADCCLYESDVPRRSSAGRRPNPRTHASFRVGDKVVVQSGNGHNISTTYNLGTGIVVEINHDKQEAYVSFPNYHSHSGEVGTFGTWPLNNLRKLGYRTSNRHGGGLTASEPLDPHREGNPAASRFVLLDAGPSAGHHGADDRYTLICTTPQGSGSRAYYNYLGFGTGVSGHGEFTASEFRELKAERYRSLGKSIKIEALPANMRRLAESFIADCG